MSKIIRLVSVLTVLTVFIAGNAAAEDPAKTDKWQFHAAIYGVLPDIKGETADGSSIDIGLDTILDNLIFTVMGNLGARKGKWTFAADVMYLNMGDDESGTVPMKIGSHVRPVEVNSDLDMKALIVTPMAGYNVLSKDRFRLDILAGARYFYLDVDVKLDAGPVRESASDSGSVWDAIVGVRGRVSVNDKWYLPYHLDIGTGESDLTYQLYGGVGYRFTKVDLEAGYRYLRWDFDDSPVFDNLYIAGPMVGVKFRF